MFNEQTLNKLKQESLFEVLNAKNTRAASALYAYARYLNQIPLQYGFFPLYMKIFETNNQYAVDALIEGFEPERFLDLVVVPNHFVLRAIFKTLDVHRPNTLYEKTVRAFCGIIKRVYHIVEDGYRTFSVTVTDLNNLAKHLNERESQDYPANRVILDILQDMSGLDRRHETDKAKLDVGRQANRIRGDFLDNQRKLIQAITDVVLKRSETVDLGITPEQVQ
ncbi:hypothetical protein KJ966_14210 [bacterium]|nr:hypothetical protein [bacterium]